MSVRSKFLFYFILFCVLFFLISHWKAPDEQNKLIKNDAEDEFFDVVNDVEADSSVSETNIFLLSEEGHNEREFDRLDIAPKLINFNEIDKVDEMGDVVISAVETINDGTLNLKNLSKDMVDKGRFFMNDFHKLRGAASGSKVSIQIAEIAAVGHVNDTSFDAYGNHGVTVKFSQKNSGYLTLFFSVESGGYHGQIFIMGEHYKYMANSDIVVLVNMNGFVTTRID